MAATRAINEAQRRRRKFKVDLQERVQDCVELGQRGLVLAGGGGGGGGGAELAPIRREE
jgi:hypothetical protein